MIKLSPITDNISKIPKKLSIISIKYIEPIMQTLVHSVPVKLNYSTCKRDVSRAVGIPSSGDSGHQGTESPLHAIWWGFRPVGIPSSEDSGYIPIFGIPKFLGLRWYAPKAELRTQKIGIPFFGTSCFRDSLASYRRKLT